ncbi:3-oxoacyl-ACP synthase [Stieleria sp. TO1_6]|uniref:beta-ketoacyl synthase N-terminal-like domain-containing protein n=1 Tax=Stieleria tagensis TaxID=2956795 RepID=UPI0021BCB7D1|nr:beta-ketoacyl synthase N-terminal-like domain-containing protein [Stieleria tagensis]MCO8124290.1 3-oxoacyl-ACP synthase [Stieleria tagensis]
MPRENAVITGVGIVSAVGIGQAEFFDALLDQRSGIRSLAERTDGDAVPADGEAIDGVWIGAPVVDFEPKQHVRPRKALKVMCREIQLGFASAYLAVDHAGLSDSIPATDQGAISPQRMGAVYGSEIFFNPPDELAASIRRCIDDHGVVQPGRFGDAARKEVMPLWMLKYLPNMPACQVGISINAQGPNNSLVLGDVSGAAALHEAKSYLERGLADVMLAGATGTRIAATRLAYRGDLAVPARDGRSLEDVSRPHDPQATGVVGGEGAVSLVLETAAHAKQRGARPLAGLLASASRFSASPAMRADQRSAEPDSPHSRGSAAAIALAIQAVLAEAELQAGQIGLVISHAMGDRQIDAAEADAVADCGIDCPAVAVTSLLGHAGAASGMIGLATGVLAIVNETIPPTRHDVVNPKVKFNATAQRLTSPYVLCLSHTAEGSAMAVLLGSCSEDL